MEDEQGGLLRAVSLLARVGGFTAEPDAGGRLRFSFRDELFALWGVPEGSPLRADPDVFARHVLHPEDQPQVVAAFEAGLRTGGRHDVAFRIRCVDTGETRHVRSTVEVVLGPDGRPQQVTGAQVDVTGEVLARQEAAESAALHRAVLAATPDVVFVTDLDRGGPVYVSPSLRTVLGHEPDEHLRLGAAGVARYVHPEDLARLHEADALARGLPDGGVAQVRYRVRHGDGRWLWVHRRTTPFRRGPDGAVTEVLGVLRDVSDLVLAEQRMAQLALHDALTGLPNRLLLSERVEQALATGTGRAALVYVDLDGFKRVNDTAGHATGDAVLCEVAARLRAAVRTGDTAARLGGDEFVLLLPPVAGADEQQAALQVADRAVRAVARPVVVDGVPWSVTASAGVVVAAPGSDGRRLLQDADAALYQAKARGKDRVHLLRPEQCRGSALSR